MDDYIRTNRDRYTREAITAQLVANGHDPAGVEAAWRDIEREGSDGDPSGPVSGWVLVILIALGVVAVFVTWRNVSYGANVIAPIVYAIATTVAVAVVHAIARAAQRGNTGAAAAWLAVIGVGSAAFTAITGLWPVALGLLVVLGGPALLLARSGSVRRAVAILSWLPLLIWLVSTGTCVAPAVLSGSAL